MTALGVWECPKSSSMKHFFRATWGEAWWLAALFLWTWCSSPPTPTPCFKRRLWAGAANFISLFMLKIDSRVFQCRCFLLLEPMGMWAKMVHSIPPLLGSSCLFHSRLSWSFNKSLCLRTFSSSSIAMCWISSSMVGLEDQSSPPSPVILMPIGRLGMAWFLECISTSFWGPFFLMSIGQTRVLQKSALVGRGIPKEVKKDWWSSEYIWPLSPPRVILARAIGWGDPLPSRRIVSILTLFFFFPWNVHPPFSSFGIFLRKSELSFSSFRASKGFRSAHFPCAESLFSFEILKLNLALEVLFLSMPST